MTKYLFRPLLLAALATTPLLAGADEISDQIGQGAKAYGTGDLRQALQDLQGAVVEIQQKLDTLYGKLLPEPLAGWTADDIQSQSAGMAMMGGGSHVSRSYHKTDGDGSVDIEITADSPLLAMMSAMITNPMLMNAQPGTKPYHLGGERGLIKHEANSHDWEISLLLANRVLVQVRGSDLASQGPVDAYLKALNLDAVKKAFGI
jgi:hypothetical protein